KSQLFISHVQLSQTKNWKDHVPKGFHLHQEIVSCDPYSMSVPSRTHLAPDRARIEIRNYCDVLEFALEWFKRWSPRVLTASVHIPLEDSDMVVEMVQWRLGILRTLLHN